MKNWVDCLEEDCARTSIPPHGSWTKKAKNRTTWHKTLSRENWTFIFYYYLTELFFFGTFNFKVFVLLLCIKKKFASELFKSIHALDESKTGTTIRVYYRLAVRFILTIDKKNIDLKLEQQPTRKEAKVLFVQCIMQE
jgi:hypothetical protein